MILVENLSKDFKIHKKYEGVGGTFRSFFSRKYDLKSPINNISFQINDGEMVGYIGLNGAGKSTTIKILSGLMQPTSGKCLINGIVPYEERKEYTKNIGVVFGNRSQLWWDLPVSESFSVLKKIYEVPDLKFQQRLDFLKDILELEEFYMTPVRNLSLGQKMRADLAASMLHSPSVLFLDEPTIGLDIIVKERIRAAIKQINKETNTTIFLTTHDLDDIEKICDRIIVIDKGEKIFDGNIDDVKNKFATSRIVHFEFCDVCSEFNWNTNTKGILEVHETGNGRVSIKIDRNMNLPQLIKNIVEQYEVSDITVEEPKLEEIVKGIYTKDEQNETDKE